MYSKALLNFHLLKTSPSTGLAKLFIVACQIRSKNILPDHDAPSKKQI